MKVLLIKKHITLFCSLLNLKFFFMINPYFIGAIFPKECCQEWEVRKKDIKGVGLGLGHLGWKLSIEEGGLKPSTHYRHNLSSKIPI